LRIFTGLFVLMTAAAAAAQDKPDKPDKPADAPLSLQELAAKKSAEWDALAGSLEAKLARMLPCDARVQTSIEEVSRASEARLTALGQYLKDAAAQAKSEAEAARTALADQELTARDMESERAEAEQERAAVEAQLADLGESAKHREILEGARQKLEAIASVVRQRVAAADQQAERRAALTASLQDLVAAYDARQHALEGGIVAAEREAVRWTEYYSARQARAQTECSITNQAPSRPQQKKKQ